MYIIYNGAFVRQFIWLTMAIASLHISSCKKFLEVNAPPTNAYAENVYSNDAQAAAVLTGIYANFSKKPLAGGGLVSLSLFPSLSADELRLFNAANQGGAMKAYYLNSLTNSNTGGTDFWDNIYPVIFTTNAAVEGLTKSNTLTLSVKEQLLGEAKFIRAFCYFHLVNLYGDVPLAITTDPDINKKLSRSPQTDVYNQIIIDLIDAQALLSDNYLKNDIITTTTERIRPTKWAATSLLARAYLYMGDWSNAEAQSASVIGNISIYDTVSLNEVFLKNSKESIWQLQPVLFDPSNTTDARLFILPAGGPSIEQYPVYLSSEVVNSFEDRDQRKLSWVGSVVPGLPDTSTYYYPYKYKDLGTSSSVTEYVTVLRLAEQYLIRAEARVRQNNIDGAQSDLNTIRLRAGLPPSTEADINLLLAAILHERQVELFTEWGHRWFDLKRTGNVDNVMNTVTAMKGGAWNSNWSLYPISLIELNKNSNLTQNSGY